MSARWLAIMAMVALVQFAPPWSPASAEERPQTGQIVVTGFGEARAAPDIATISVGVVTQAKSARDALAANSKAMTDAIESLKSAGIAAKDLQTSGFSLQPLYSSDRVGNQRTITGYQASNTIAMRVRDLGKIGDILDRAVSLGANSVTGPSFGLAEPEALRVEARKAAIADAERRAKLYAEVLGLKLGRVINVDETSGPSLRPVRTVMMSPAAAAAPAPPIEAGETAISASVTVIWEIAQ